MNALLLIVRRFAAFAIDWLVFGLASLPIALFFWLGGLDPRSAARTQTILLWSWLVYFALFEWLYGATIGKFVCFLAVKRSDGTRLSPWTATCRVALTFLIPCVLTVFITPGILTLNSSTFGEHVAFVISTAILMAVPLSIVVFEGQSLADAILHTCVTPVGAIAKPAAFTRRRWLLVGLLSLLVGVGFSWAIGLSSRMMYGSDDMNKGIHTFVNTFPSDLIDTRLMPSNGQKVTLLTDIRGNLMRQPHQKAESLGRSLGMMDMYGNSTSYDELMLMRRLAFYMSELPDEQRPECMAVRFQKEFDAVLTTFLQQHEMAVCNVPKGVPEQATLIDRGLDVSWQYKVNVDNMLIELIGESGQDIKRLVPAKRQNER